MKVTLLGSGEALGMPAPLCGCEFCERCETRRRPGLLIETGQATVVLDVSPDIKDQIHATGTTDVDAFFVTHHHYDHVGGLHELNHAAMAFEEHMLNPAEFEPDERPRNKSFDVFMTETADSHLRDSNAHVADRLATKIIEHGETISVGNLRVVPFPVRHARSSFDTLGFAVYHGDEKVVYAPDMREFMDDDEYENVDLLFAEGAALFRALGHGEKAELQAALRDANAKRTVLLNLSEHLQRMTTNELREVARREGYELGEDFAEYHP